MGKDERVKLDKVIQARDEAMKTLEEINNEYEGRELSDEAKTKWNEAKAEFESKNHIVEREDFLKQKRAKNSSVYDRNENDGEAKELAKYSFMEAIKYMKNPNSISADKRGFYAEMNKEGEMEASQSGVNDLSGGGLVIPAKVLNRKSYQGALTSTTEATDLVQTQFGSFIDQLNERMVLTGLGADFLTDLRGDLQFARESNAPSFSWGTENASASESTPTFDNVSMSATRGSTFVDVSNMLLRQVSDSIEARIQRQLVGKAQRAIESAAIDGSGSASPTGILQTSGIGSVAGGTDGLAPAWSHIVDLEKEVAVDNADVGALAYLTNAKVRGALKQTDIGTDTGRMIWPVNATDLNGYPVGISNLVPSDLTKGTGEDLSAIIYGNFNDLVIGMWGGIEILVDPYTQALTGSTRLVLNVFADVGVLRAVSFSAMKDAIA